MPDLTMKEPRVVKATPADYKAYIQPKHEWAINGFTLRSDSNADWVKMNPEYQWCRSHKQLSRVRATPTSKKEPSEHCGICLKYPDKIPLDAGSLEQARSLWETEYNNCEQLVKNIRTTPLNASLVQVFEKAAVTEWRYWIQYEVLTFKVGAELKTREPERDEYNNLSQKITDSVVRNGSNTNKVFCPRHQELGDEFPWRLSRQRYNTCMICINPIEGLQDKHK